MRAAPRICIFTETYYPVVGGGETQAKALAEGLVANGFSVIILTRRSDPTFKAVEQSGAITIYRLPPVGRQHLKKWGLLFTSIPILIRLRQQYDLIFVSGFRVVGIVTVLMARFLGKSCILKADSPGEMSGAFFTAGLAKLGLEPSRWLFRWFLSLRNKILRKADAFVAISSELAAELEAHHVTPTLIQMIPNSVDVHRFHPVSPQEKLELRQKLGIPQQAKIVIFTGRLVSYKGLPLLLQVWRQLRQHHHYIQLFLVGAGGLDIHNCEMALKNYVKTQDLQSSVHFTGDVHNVDEYLQASDIFVFPTQREAFGISLIEAMACGLPVISTPVGGVKDILQHEANGLVVDESDFLQLYAALERLILNLKLATLLGQAACKTVQDRYSAESVIQRYIELFKRIINEYERNSVQKNTGDVKNGVRS